MPDRRESTEGFSNPAPPHRHIPVDEDDDSHKLTNDDFRKLLMTPSVSSHEKTREQPSSRPRPPIAIHDEFDDIDEDDQSSAARRRRKKLYYAKLMKQKEEREKELSQKYRDRARERRDGQNNDYEQTETISTTADYKAVAPTAKIDESYAERRKQVIQESKYLGGDMEHTHLVKGLDYALLEKVRAEISSKETGDDDLEKAVTQNEEKEVDEEEQMNFKSKLGRNVYRQVFRSHPPARNDLFLPGRMAYVIDLDDEYADTDVPTTLIRSKADCPTIKDTRTLSTNDIVINKLTEILTYLRHGKGELRRMKKKEKMKEEKSRLKVLPTDDSIYDDIGEYDATQINRKNRREKVVIKEEKGREKHDRNRERDERYPEEKRRSYFEKPMEEEEVKEKVTSAKDFVKNINDRFKNMAEPLETERLIKQEQDRNKKLKAKTEIDSYAECYPGMMESADAIGDSDDEADFMKMDQGTKKGPVGRWDFDTHEEYSHYMSKKEALPKAAFQYGVKMSDGRKTRRGGPKDEKAELDREWQKIQRIIDKRKGSEASTGAPKKAKY